MIPVMRPSLPTATELLPYIEKIDSSHIYSNYGPIAKSLVAAYADYLGVSANRIVPMANATLALQGCLSAFQETNWLIPDYTFAATAHAAVNANKKIFFADVDPDDFQLSIPVDIDMGRFGAIPVMPFGSKIDFTRWKGINSLIIDAAASLGAPKPDFQTMPDNSFVVYSLHATKVLGAGEGALVVCGNDHASNTLRAWSNFGFSGSRVSENPGTNAKMSEIACAIALASINNIDREKLEWRASLDNVISANYPNRFRTVVESYEGFYPYWIIQAFDIVERNQLSDFLLKNGVESRSWWASRLSDMPAFRDCNTLSNNHNSKVLSDTHLGLPMWRGLSREKIDEIAGILLSFNSKI
jgi:dTDP-4-amino-4,6-dideoxygalactose transaminase